VHVPLPRSQNGGLSGQGAPYGQQVVVICPPTQAWETLPSQAELPQVSCSHTQLPYSHEACPVR
jgi:hypothetical protein